MKTNLLRVASMCLLVVATVALSTGTKAAEVAVPHTRIVKASPCVGPGPCSPECLQRHHCRPFCPDGYSCYPLYGGYGPYGGIAYWDAYTGDGWGYPRW